MGLTVRDPCAAIIKNTSTALIATNPIFLYGQMIIETDTNRAKTGDGVSNYTNLTYAEWGYEIVEAAGTDTYTGNFSKPFFLAYFPMLRIRVRFANANTGASTINLNGLGAISIRKHVSAALISGDIIAGGIYDLTYDGTNFQIIFPGSGGAGGVVSVSGTLNRITSTGGINPVIDIAATYVGQTSITTLGTITTGVWNGTTIAIANGGTGQITATLAFNALSPLTTRGDLITRDATNNIRLAKGATGRFLTTDANDVIWSTATLPGTAGATGTILRSDGTNWVATTNTYPNTTGVNQILYATAANVIGSSSTFVFNGTSLMVGEAALVDASSLLELFRSANSITRLAVINNTSGTGAASVISISADNLTTNTSFSTFSAGYTTSGMAVASTSILSSTTSGGLNIGTVNAVQLSLWTNNTKRVILSSAGLFTVGIGTGSVAAGTLFDVQSGATGGAIIGGSVAGERGVKIFQSAGGYAYLNGYSRTAGVAVDLSVQLDGGNFLLGSTESRATTAGTRVLHIFDGTAPVGTLANGCSFYSTAGEMRVMDAAGNPTLLSPHDKNNNWIFDSYVGKGKDRKRIIVDMEKMVKAINEKFGWDFVHEFEII